MKIPTDQKIGLNGIATFTCVTKGNPPPSVFWTREGSQVLMFAGNTYGHFHISGDGTLKIQGAQKEDTGFLVCSALSVAGSTSVRAYLQVNTTRPTLNQTSKNAHPIFSKLPTPAMRLHQSAYFAQRYALTFPPRQ